GGLKPRLITLHLLDIITKITHYYSLSDKSDMSDGSDYTSSTPKKKPPLVNIISCYYNRHSDMKMLIRNILLGLILFFRFQYCQF
ncbi:MAG: hypothetical protein WBL85_01285, partial [Sedimentisphaerales bacterium]